MNTGWWAIHLEALGAFRRTWPQLVLTDLAGRGLAVVILAPVVGLLLKVFLATTTEGVVTDGAILLFFLHPAGLAALVIVGAVSLGILFAESGALMVIGFGSFEDRHVSWLDGLKHVFKHALSLVNLGWHAIVRLLLIAAPFLAGVGAVYWLLLRKYDINFYLAHRPPTFWAAVTLAGVLIAVLAMLILRTIAAWLLALPMVLFEGRTGKASLRTSERATAVHRNRITLWLAGWLLAVSLLSTLVTYVVGTLGDFLVPRRGASVLLVVLGLGVVLLVSGFVNLSVTILATMLFPLISLGIYRSLAGPGELVPPIGRRGTLGRRPAWRIPGKAPLWGIAAAAVLIVAGTYLVTDDDDWEDHADIIAHRGAALAAPENTMAAFEHAIRVEADWIELDVQENADGTVIVKHDRDFMRVAGVNLKVWDATDEDLEGIDIGSYRDAGFSDQRVPTLQEALELAKGHLGVFIELKYYGHDQDLEAKVVDIVEATGMTRDVVVMSLKYDGVRKIAALRPGWTGGLLNTVSLGDLTRLEVDFLALNASAATYSLIRRAHRRGMSVYAWTINDPVQMSVMMSRGVDGLITDDPAMGRRVQEIRAELTPFGRLLVWIAGEAGLLDGVEESSTQDDA